jgi:uncharacterized repeat protein (TIGR03803 family)
VIMVTPTGTESVLYFFGSAPGDGAYPYGSLIQATDGNFYGMTAFGGANLMGAVIMVTPVGKESLLYSFGSVPGDGAYPYGSLIQATDGNFYAMTSAGGANGAGAVIKITPTGTESVLYSFGSSPSDGAIPSGSLIQASDGNFYAMTLKGGTDGTGTVIKVTPSGTESVLYSFGVLLEGGDGSYPQGSLIQASDGNLYGMTSSGGANATPKSPLQLGAVIKITLAGTESVLYSFGSTPGDGWDPHGSLIQASDGNLYGMTFLGGAIGLGAVIKITLAGTESVLHSFGSMPGDGLSPNGNLIQASDTNLYGLTNLGGASDGGAVIKINW